MNEGNDHPHAIVGDFVKKYEEFIRTCLKEGDLSRLCVLVMKDCIKRKEFIDVKRGGNIHALGKYAAAVDYFQDLMEQPDLAEELFPVIDRDVSEIELMLNKDSDYRMTKRTLEKNLRLNRLISL
jgi:hypothetical protein